MAEPLKLMYSIQKMEQVASVIKSNFKSFNEEKFIAHFKTKTWNEAELKARVRLIAQALHDTLLADYKRAIDILIPASHMLSLGYFGVFFSDFVEQYGQDDWDTSMRALSEFTKTSTAEFAIRPFIVKDENLAMKQMHEWSKDKNHHIRRLSSEGCRPRLPWGMKLHSFVKDPSPVLSILENLKNDDELYVRKSVANNLNDISKDNPEIALATAKKWIGKTPHTDWIVSHAMRGLLKAGNKDALALFGHADAKGLSIKALNLSNQKIKLGDVLQFNFEVENKNSPAKDCRIEYAVDYVKANGTHSRKVFQITKAVLNKGTHAFTRTQRMQDFTTRKHYSGQHHLHILLNGEVKASASFMLKI
ncbi:MAG: DNA alkylation repair protein [Flavobacteriales bacterium]